MKIYIAPIHVNMLLAAEQLKENPIKIQTVGMGCTDSLKPCKNWYFTFTSGRPFCYVNIQGKHLKR